MHHRFLAITLAAGIGLTFVSAANAHADIGVYFGAAPAYEPPPVVYAPPPPPVVYQPEPVYVNPPVAYGGDWRDEYGDRDRDWDHGRHRGWDHDGHHHWHHDDDE